MPRNASLGGIDAVIRDHTGLVLAWSRKKLTAHLDVETAEAFAARLGINLAKQINCNKLILEGDALQVIKGLKHNKDLFSVNGDLYATLRDELASIRSSKSDISGGKQTTWRIISITISPLILLATLIFLLITVNLCSSFASSLFC